MAEPIRQLLDQHFFMAKKPGVTQKRSDQETGNERDANATMDVMNDEERYGPECVCKRIHEGSKCSRQTR